MYSKTNTFPPPRHYLMMFDMNTTMASISSLKTSAQDWSAGLQQRSRILIGKRILIALVIISIGLAWTMIEIYSLGLSSHLTGRLPTAQFGHDISKVAQNETLGFGRIFYVSMPQ